jgi:phytoene/squalene synthetase
VAEGDQSLNGCAFPFEHRLDRAIPVVASPSCDVRRQRPPTHGVAEEDLRESRPTDAFVSLMREECAKARESFRRAEPLLCAVAADARLCVALLAGVYRAILKKIEGDPARVLRARAELTSKEKAALLARSLPRTAAGRWP